MYCTHVLILLLYLTLFYEQVWYTNPIFSVALGGILPFGAVCIELFFIMTAMWLHQVQQHFAPPPL